MKIRAGLASLALLGACSGPSSPGGAAAGGGDVASFMGSWVYQASIVAPWMGGEGFSPEPDAEIMATPLVLAEGAASGPAALSCAPAAYAVKPVALAETFEGHVTDAYVAKAALGIEGDQIPTLTVTCQGATGDAMFSYHLIKADTLLIGLNNTVYQLSRPKAAPAEPAKQPG
jgi:hypothetical protein